MVCAHCEKSFNYYRKICATSAKKKYNVDESFLQSLPCIVQTNLRQRIRTFREEDIAFVATLRTKKEKKIKYL